MTIRQFIDQLASGEHAAAKETLDNVLSAKSFDALDEYKKQIASGIFGSENSESEENVEVQDAE